MPLHHRLRQCRRAVAARPELRLPGIAAATERPRPSTRIAATRGGGSVDRHGTRRRALTRPPRTASPPPRSEPRKAERRANRVVHRHGARPAVHAGALPGSPPAGGPGGPTRPHRSPRAVVCPVVYRSYASIGCGRANRGIRPGDAATGGEPRGQDDGAGSTGNRHRTPERRPPEGVGGVRLSARSAARGSRPGAVLSAGRPRGEAGSPARQPMAGIWRTWPAWTSLELRPLASWIRATPSRTGRSGSSRAAIDDRVCPASTVTVFCGAVAPAVTAVTPVHAERGSDQDHRPRLRARRPRRLIRTGRSTTRRHRSARAAAGDATAPAAAQEGRGGRGRALRSWGPPRG